MPKRNGPEDDGADLGDVPVLAALRELGEHVSRLRIAPTLVQRHFAGENGDLAVLAPMFADIKRRILDALATAHEKHHASHREQRKKAALEKEAMGSASVFQGAL